MKLQRLAALMAAGLMALTACGQDTTTPAAGGDDKPAEKITIEHTAGTTELDGPAERIVVLDLGSLDNLQALGLQDKVVGLPKATPLPKSLAAFSDDKYADVGTLKEPDLEAIAELDPDLVIAGFRSSELAKELMPKFPTVDVTYDTADDYYEGVSYAAKIVAKATGEEEAMDKKLAELESTIKDAKGKVPAESKVLMLMSSGGKISAVHPNGRFDLAYDGLGLKPAIEEQAKGEQAHGDAIAFEAIQQANPDVMYVMDRDAAIGAEGGKAAEQVLDNELVRATNAWKNDKVVYLDGGRWYLMLHGVDNAKAMVEELLQAA